MPPSSRACAPGLGALTRSIAKPLGQASNVDARERGVQLHGVAQALLPCHARDVPAGARCRRAAARARAGALRAGSALSTAAQEAPPKTERARPWLHAANATGAPDTELRGTRGFMLCPGRATNPACPKVFLALRLPLLLLSLAMLIGGSRFDTLRPALEGQADRAGAAGDRRCRCRRLGRFGETLPRPLRNAAFSAGRGGVWR